MNKRFHCYVNTEQTDRNQPHEKRVIPRAISVEYVLEYDRWYLTITIGLYDVRIDITSAIRFIKETEDEVISKKK